MEFLTACAVPAAVFCAGLYFLFRLRAFRLLRLRQTPGARRPRPDRRGGMRPRRALMIALGGTLGVGNLSGVGAAIALGGPGAVFWMWLSSLAAASLKYAETVLAVGTRGPGGGGAPVYIRESLRRAGLPRIGAALSVLFSLLCLGNTLTLGCAVQVSAAAGAAKGVLGLPALVTGGAFALFCAAAASGGTRTVDRFCAAAVPLMTGVFFLLSAAVLALRARELPGVLSLILRCAFAPAGTVLSPAGAGLCGAGLRASLRQGVMRGLISNEAGAGSSTFAHAAADTDSPARQGCLGIAEVLTDTTVLCTVTAFVLLLSPDALLTGEPDPVMITVRAYGDALGLWARPVLCVLVLVFCLAALASQLFTGFSVLDLLLPRAGDRKKRLARGLYAVLFCLCALWGALGGLSALWDAADLVIALMILVNVPVLLLSAPQIRRETDLYFPPQRKRAPFRRREGA